MNRNSNKFPIIQTSISIDISLQKEKGILNAYRELVMYTWTKEQEGGGLYCESRKTIIYKSEKKLLR